MTTDADASTTTIRPRRPGRGLALGLAAALTVVASGCSPAFTALPSVTGCDITPVDAFWRADISARPVKAQSATWVATAGSTKGLKADFGAGLWDGGPIGIPYNIVAATQPKVRVTFEYADESDQVLYPVPANPKIEGGTNGTGDRHIVMVDKDNCILYELFDARPDGDGTWHAGSGAVWNMRSNAMRPGGWTSADAAGLPILPGLVRYEEFAGGAVNHAIRMTVPATASSYVWPASHRAGAGTIATTMPMGTWLRLKSTVDPNAYDAYIRPILVALKTYGAVIADNGSAWYVSGAPDDRWNDDKLRLLGTLHGSDFEVVDAAAERVATDSYQGASAR